MAARHPPSIAFTPRRWISRPGVHRTSGRWRAQAAGVRGGQVACCDQRKETCSARQRLPACLVHARGCGDSSPGLTGPVLEQGSSKRAKDARPSSKQSIADLNAACIRAKGDSRRKRDGQLNFSLTRLSSLEPLNALVINVPHEGNVMNDHLRQCRLWLKTGMRRKSSLHGGSGRRFCPPTRFTESLSVPEPRVRPSTRLSTPRRSTAELDVGVWPVSSSLNRPRALLVRLLGSNWAAGRPTRPRARISLEPTAAEGWKTTCRQNIPITS